MVGVGSVGAASDTYPSTGSFSRLLPSASGAASSTWNSVPRSPPPRDPFVPRRQIRRTFVGVRVESRFRDASTWALPCDLGSRSGRGPLLVCDGWFLRPTCKLRHPVLLSPSPSLPVVVERAPGASKRRSPSNRPRFEKMHTIPSRAEIKGRVANASSKDSGHGKSHCE